jgi:hypothetical protein
MTFKIVMALCCWIKNSNVKRVIKKPLRNMERLTHPSLLRGEGEGGGEIRG